MNNVKFSLFYTVLNSQRMKTKTVNITYILKYLILSNLKKKKTNIYFNKLQQLQNE